MMFEQNVPGRMFGFKGKLNESIEPTSQLYFNLRCQLSGRCKTCLEVDLGCAIPGALVAPFS